MQSTRRKEIEQKIVHSATVAVKVRYQILENPRVQNTMLQIGPINITA